MKAAPLFHISRIAADVRYEIEKWNTDFNEKLEGCCAIASAELHRVLRQNNIQSMISSNHQHSFVSVGEFIVDITATQFVPYYLDRKYINGDGILLEHISTLKRYPFYNIVFHSSNLEIFHEWQVEHDWPDFQRVSPKESVIKGLTYPVIAV